ncbi:MAG: sodium:alanine symporter family protein [Oscillospiraceae bacterium]|jgi:AGCS family alanine or glycine:cation symporter|nr:sodium:alanine symporter family protein [Oscillospiraceae bacterium]
MISDKRQAMEGSVTIYELRAAHFFSEANAALSAFLWGAPMLAVFLLTGLYLTVRSRGFSILHFPTWFRTTFGAALRDRSVRRSGDRHAISQFQALTSALAACLGTGNIVGVATAVRLGGPGAVFWMWISAVLGMMTCYTENVLGIRYRWRTEDGSWMGGPMAYLSRGLKSPGLAGIYAALLALAAFGIGNMTQTNSIAQAAQQSLGLSPWITGGIVTVLAALVILGGIQRIAKVTEALIPLMTGVFLLACAVVLALRAKALPGVLAGILREAFTWQSAAAGAAGYGIRKAMRYGVARGVFSNEAGLGSSAVIHGAADVKDPAVQGMWGIAEVFLDTVVMCTVTALVLLSTGVTTAAGISDNSNGVALSGAAFASVFGVWGERFVLLSVAFFAFATLVGWSYYGEQGAKYLLGGKMGRKGVSVYRCLYLAVTLVGSVMKLEAVWNLADTLNGLMAIPNLIGVLWLAGEAIPKRTAAASRAENRRRTSSAGKGPA